MRYYPNLSKSHLGGRVFLVYVGIEDIIACGGNPLACSITIGYNSQEIGNQVFRGVIDATNCFHVPLIRGQYTN